MAIFTIILDRRNKSTKINKYNLSIRICDKHIVRIIPTGIKFSENEYQNFLDESINDPFTIELREKIKLIMEKSTIIYPEMTQWDVDAFKKFVLSGKNKKTGKNRIIYVFEFPDHSAYVGLTWNTKKRKTQHFLNGPVRDYIEKTGLQPEFKILTDFLDQNTASQKEEEYKLLYKNNGWKILNIIKTGGLGGGYIYWTKEKIYIEALKFKKRSDFCSKSSGAYEAARKNGWLDDVCSHMDTIFHDKWTFEEAAEAALDCKTRNEFCIRYGGAYAAAKQNGWMPIITQHMNKPYHDWSVEEIVTLALRYPNNTEFKKANISAYSAAVRRKITETLTFLRKVKQEHDIIN